MIELTLDEIKKIQLEILEEVSRFCDENDIQYTLYFGSLLGAVRHGGYIPWDDDIDLAMPRVHYEKFVREFCNSSSNYKIIKYDINKRIYAQFAKISRSDTILIEDADIECELGVNIDVFPIDGIPSNTVLRYITLGTLKTLYAIMAIKTVRSGLRFRSKMKNAALIFLKLIFIWISKAQVAMILNYIINAIRSEKSEVVMHICFDQYRLSDSYLRNLFVVTEKISFENLKVNAIVGREHFLNTHYGDFMTLPPLEKRVSHHLFRAYKK